MCQLFGDELVLLLRAFSRRRERRGAGSHSPLQVPTGTVVRAVSGGLVSARSPAGAARGAVGLRRARAVVSGERTPPRIQPGRAPCFAPGRRIENSLERVHLASCRTYQHANPAFAPATGRERPPRVCPASRLPA